MSAWFLRRLRHRPLRVTATSAARQSTCMSELQEAECHAYNQQAIKRYAVRAVVRQVMICADDDDIVASRLLRLGSRCLEVWAS